ncbi:MAG: ABC transporter permease [bacterium]
MMIRDLIQETRRALLSNKIRSSLTILGIVIGIGSVIAMVSIGQGAQSDIESRIKSLGSNLLIIMPGSQRGVGSQVSQGRGSAQTLTTDDANAIMKEIKYIEAVSPEVSTRKQIIYKGKNTNTIIYGAVPEYLIVKNTILSQGSFITNQHLGMLSKVAVLGPDTRDNLFGPDFNPIGQTIRIDKINFTVIGVTEAKGASGFGSSDDVVYVPLTTAQHYLTGSKTLNTINVQVEKENLMSQVQEEINGLLLMRHGIADINSADFSIMNQADIVSAMSSVTGTFTLLLGAIAGISLLVGGIGIMNMMLTSVTERTKEIGLRKSVGAKKQDIRQQFLSEAVILTLIGGVIGIGLGWLISNLISRFGGITTSISLNPVLLAVGVSAVIGIVFGYYPAMRAARLNPIDALRYE